MSRQYFCGFLFIRTRNSLEWYYCASERMRKPIRQCVSLSESSDFWLLGTLGFLDVLAAKNCSETNSQQNRFHPKLVASFSAPDNGSHTTTYAYVLSQVGGSKLVITQIRGDDKRDIKATGRSIPTHALSRMFNAASHGMKGDL